MKLRVLELFSGMGGMHCALKEALSEDAFEVAAAIDISDVPNKVYKFNFPGTKHLNKNICGLTAKFINDLAINTILMSPPCQPFTRQGHQKGLDDNRAQPLVTITNLIPDLPDLKFLLLENVKGFEESSARDMFCDTLTRSGFEFQEFLISSAQLGVPNSRLRYYLIAKRKSEPDTFGFQTKSELWTEIWELQSQVPLPKYPSRIQDYLESTSSSELLEVPPKILAKRSELLDIVTKDSERSCCFTKAYGKYAEGTGSVIQQAGDLDDVYQRSRSAPTEEEKVSILQELNLRYFSSREVANLLGYPSTIQFPQDMTLHQKYRCLGNSLNVHVVSFLLQLLFKPSPS